MANDRTLGGKFYASIGGQRFEAVGELTLKRAQKKVEGKTSSNGFFYTTEEAMPASAKCKFLRKSAGDPMVFFNATAPFDMTFVEASRGVRHQFTQATAVGEPEENITTGEVDGIEIMTDRYTSTQ
jgi:hypothetical protein